MTGTTGHRQKMAATIAFEDNGLVVARASGVVLRQEFDDLKKQMVAHINQLQGKVCALVFIEEDFKQLETLAEWSDNQDDEIIQKNVKQLAIIGAPEWAEAAKLFFLQGLLPFPIQYFPFAHEELARAWLE